MPRLGIEVDIGAGLLFGVRLIPSPHAWTIFNKKMRVHQTEILHVPSFFFRIPQGIPITRQDDLSVVPDPDQGMFRAAGISVP